jgi:phosphatidate phosphatase APP1
VALTTRKSTTGQFPILVQVLHETGLSVISDIDDTIKISNVRDRGSLLRNTFCRPFEPVKGMAEVYQSWAQPADAQFHYVSASPWQLYLPLSEFLRTNSFPAGTFAMKTFRAKDSSFLQLFVSPERYKLKTIEPLFTRFPKRQFVLVGDSGEKDPEAYGVIARRHPSQVRRVLIRDVTNENADSIRYQKAFGGLPGELWQIFKEPAEIRDAIRTVR